MITPSNPHFVAKGAIGISVRSGVLWFEMAPTEDWHASAYAGAFEKGEYFLIVSEPMYYEIMQGMWRWFYKVVFGEKICLVKVDDIVNPYYNSSATS